MAPNTRPHSLKRSGKEHTTAFAPWLRMARQITSYEAELRAAEARRFVAHQRDVIAQLKAAGECSAEAECSLEIYLSALKPIEDHARKLGEENEAKRGETRKCVRTRPRRGACHDIIAKIQTAT